MKEAGLTENCHLHCAIAELREEKNQRNVEIRERKGFERLTEAGFDEEDVRAFREQFRQSMAHREQIVSDEELRRAEEEWISNIDTNDRQTVEVLERRQHIEDLQRLSIIGTLQDLFFGMICGFIFSFLMLFWVKKMLAQVFCCFF